MEPTRTCILCKRKNKKSELLRIVSNEKREAVYDEKQKINARAIYLCKDVNCLNNCEKRILKNKFKCKIDIDKDKLVDIIKKIGFELGE